jgi:SGT1 protein
MHLHGVTNYGDSVEDEWLIVHLVRELSKRFEEIWVKVVDTDGEFLLIEAANALPRWLNPEIADNRVGSAGLAVKHLILVLTWYRSGFMVENFVSFPLMPLELPRNKLLQSRAPLASKRHLTLFHRLLKPSYILPSLKLKLSTVSEITLLKSQLLYITLLSQFHES